jgi:hypothetical protein
MPDPHDNGVRKHLVDYVLGHLSQPEYVARYPANPTSDDIADVIIHVALALIHRRPLGLLVHHSCLDHLDERLRHIAAVIEPYGYDGVDEEAALSRLLPQLERSR